MTASFRIFILYFNAPIEMIGKMYYIIVIDKQECGFILIVGEVFYNESNFYRSNT